MELILRYIELLELCRSELYDPFLADIEERCLEAIGILLRYNHNHDPPTGRFTRGNGVDNGGESGIIKLEDIEIGKSLSAKAKNYNIMDLQTGDTFHFSEGTKIQDVQVFAGKGSKTIFRKADKYAKRYGGKPNDWQHCKGKGVVDYYGEERKAEVHWVQCESVGKYEFFIKEWLE